LSAEKHSFASSFKPKNMNMKEKALELGNNDRSKRALNRALEEAFT